MINIVLLEPEKPDNVGNIGRTCVCAKASLHLIYPLGFQMTRSKIHHAGLDYWDRLEKYTYDNFYDFLKENNFIETQKKIKQENKKLYFATTKAKKTYTDVKINDGDFIMFGKESAGIPEEFLKANEDYCIRIPMDAEERSLNLSNSVAIVLYEALRQNNFFSLNKKGNFRT